MKNDAARFRPDRFPVIKRKGTKVLQLLETLRDLTTRLDDVVANQAAVSYTLARSVITDFSQPGADDPMSSRVCRQVDCGKEYAFWQQLLGRTVAVDRKDWEWSGLLRALETADLLKPGVRGLGFGIGSEPIPAAMAARGVEAVATDLAVDDPRAAHWVEHALSMESLRRPAICPDEVLNERVSVRAVDMNHIPSDLRDFDFIWSTCAFEHLGSLEAGLKFVENSMACLKPGGLAVHTTEFNLDSNDGTIADGGTVLFRRRDMDELERRLSSAGHTMSPFTEGERGPGIYDYLIDVPPKHFGTLIVRHGAYRITPAIIVVRAKSGDSPA